MSVLVGTVIELTDRVEAAIESGDWLGAQQLESERRCLLEQLALSGTADLRATFAALETRNFRLIGLVEHLKRRVLRDAAVARTARDGTAAYAALGAGSSRPSHDAA